MAKRSAPKEDNGPPPLPVEVENEEPLIVEIADSSKDEIIEEMLEKNGKEHHPPPVPKEHGLTLPPTTTEQEDIVTEGQRRVNLIWEFTQAGIAVSVTLGMIIVPLLGVRNDTLENAFFLIVGFYFSRTNHQAIGGIGRKPDLPTYRGR